MGLAEDVTRLLRFYPRIFFACHERHRRDPAGGSEISAHQGQILDHLDDVEGTSLTSLAEHMGVTPSTMSLTMDRLEARGLLVRERDPEDRRRVMLTLTAAGLRVKRSASVLEPRRVRAMLARMPADLRRSALQGLAALAAAAEEEMTQRSRSRAWVRPRT